MHDTVDRIGKYWPIASFSMQLRGCKIRKAGQEKPDIDNLLDQYGLTKKKK